MWVKVAGIILRNRISILVILGILTLFMAFQSQRIEMSYQYAPLLPEDDPVFLDNEYFVQEFGNNSEMVVLAVQDSAFFNTAHLQQWLQLKDELVALEGVSGVFSVLDAYDLVRNADARKFEVQSLWTEGKAESIAQFTQRLSELPLYEHLLYNPETHTYLMAVFLVPEILQSPERVALIEGIKAAGARFDTVNGTRLYYSGLPYIRVETAEMVKRELNMFIFLTLGVTALVIFLFFRSFKVVLFAMLVVGIAVIWALGSQALLGYKITILTGMIPPLIIVIGIPNSVFMLNKYHQEFRLHGNRIKSLQRMIRKIGNATFLTNLTTASGFITFVFTSSRLLVEFGIVAAINIMVVFLLSLLLIPIVFSFLGDPKERHVKHLDRKWMNALVERLLQISLYHRSKVLLFTLFLLLAGFYGIGRMHTTGYMLDDVPHDNKLYSDLQFFEKHFSGLMPLEILIDTRKPNGVLQSSTLQGLNRVQERLDSLPELSKPLSYLNVVKFARQAYYNGHPDFYGVPNSRERNFIMSHLQGAQDGPRALMATFIDSTRQKARINLRMADVGTGQMARLDAEVRAIVEAEFPAEDYHTLLTGASVVFFNGTSYLIRNLLLSLGLAVVLIASFMAWMFSSKRMVLVSLIPNLIPLIITAALMGYFGIPIKPSTILVFSIAFGISVDDTIHFLAKYRQELSETNWNIRAAVMLATKETGLSMIYTSIILFFGFGVFSLSEFGGTVALGLLVAFTLFVALFSNLILLPTLLLTLERLITNQSFKEPLLAIYNEEEDIEHSKLVIARKGSASSEDCSAESSSKDPLD